MISIVRGYGGGFLDEVGGDVFGEEAGFGKGSGLDEGGGSSRVFQVPPGVAKASRGLSPRGGRLLAVCRNIIGGLAMAAHDERNTAW